MLACHVSFWYYNVHGRVVLWALSLFIWLCIVWAVCLPSPRGGNMIKQVNYYFLRKVSRTDYGDYSCSMWPIYLYLNKSATTSQVTSLHYWKQHAGTTVVWHSKFKLSGVVGIKLQLELLHNHYSHNMPTQPQNEFLNRCEYSEFGVIVNCNRSLFLMYRHKSTEYFEF